MVIYCYNAKIKKSHLVESDFRRLSDSDSNILELSAIWMEFTEGMEFDMGEIIARLSFRVQLFKKLH